MSSILSSIEKVIVGEVKLSASRTLAYRAFGNGFPVLFFPGNLNSRYFRPAWGATEVIAEKCGVRVIVVDRPGVGFSSLPPIESYNEFAELIAEFVSVTKLESLGLLGFSSGGPYAAACACRLNSKVNKLVLVSADGEYANPDLNVDPTLIYGMTSDLVLSNSEKIARDNCKKLFSSYETMKNEERKKIALFDLEEATRFGYLGVAQDCILENLPWTFKRPENQSFSVQIIHGEDDESVPVRVAQWYVTQFENSTLQIISGENHSLIRRKWQDILKIFSRSNL